VVARLGRVREPAPAPRWALLVADARAAAALLREQLAPGAVHLAAALGALGALALGVALEDDCTVEQVASGRQEEVRRRVGVQGERREGGEGVDGYGDGGRADVRGYGRDLVQGRQDFGVDVRLGDGGRVVDGWVGISAEAAELGFGEGGDSSCWARERKLGVLLLGLRYCDWALTRTKHLQSL
jgi:hypothetical protein